MKSAILLLIGLVCLVRSDIIPYTPAPVEYESEWAVHMHPGTDPRMLEEQGFEVVEQVGTIDDLYVVRHKETQARHLASRAHKFMPSHEVTATLSSQSHVKWAEQQFLQKMHTRAATFNDPLFTGQQQWHLKNVGQFQGLAGIDANIQEAWDAGFNGLGVRIAVVDDGFQSYHPDLAARFQLASSFSFNAPTGNSPNPNNASDFHGTSAAGVALAANNTLCGVGAAYMAEGSGIRLIAAAVTDATIGNGITYRNQLNHIYTNSWGPEDNGITTGGPGQASRTALATGVSQGRNNLGSVYLWAAGNGLLQNDNCNNDGWASARETIAVGAIGNDGTQAYYSEPCSAMLITAPSSSANPNAGIRTSDLMGTFGYNTGNCDDSFGGTSSACPLVAGIVALVLQANPDLTWRDIPVILAKTAKKIDASDPDWVQNAAGYHVNHKYGFGMVDASAAVRAALEHENIAPQQVIAPGTTTVAQAIPDYPSTGVETTFTVSSSINVEKVTVIITADHPTSGDLQIVLVSPQGTESYLSTPHAFVATTIAANMVYVIGEAPYGPALSMTPITGNFLRANPVLACTTITNCAALSGRIAIANTGTCASTVKTKLLQNCGAIAVVIANTNTQSPNVILRLDGTDPTVTIPTFSASLATARMMADNAAGVLKFSQYQANNYRTGWQMASVRLLGEPAAGTWKIKISDGVPGNTGTFNSYSVMIYGSDTDLTASASSLQICFLVPMFALLVSLLW